TEGAGCRVPSNTRNMYAPRGRVRTSTATKKSAIWVHPMAVISESLRPEQRVSQVDDQKHREREPDAVFQVHGAPPRRAQKRTYAHETAKNPTVSSTSTRSIMPRPGASPVPGTPPPRGRPWRSSRAGTLRLASCG